MRQSVSLGMLVVALAGCAVGPRVEDHALPRQPTGATVTVNTREGAIAGELLAVQDTAIVILSRAQRVTMVPFRAIRQGQAELAGTITHGGRTPDPRQLERLRLVSRFPQGLDPELERRLLTALGQGQIEVIDP